MKRFELVSDLHFDFYRDVQGIIEGWNPQTNTLVIAGDMCEMRNLREEWIDALLDSWTNVIYVPGNHDYYGGSLNPDTFRDLIGINVLTRGVIECDGIKFAGATTWFPHPLRNRKYEQMISDFSMIGNYAGIPFYEDVHAEHLKDKEFFHYVNADVWITHHLPFAQSIHPKYAGAQSNLFFYAQMEDVITDCVRIPSVIVHGHTHESVDYTINHRFSVLKESGRDSALSTRVVCNPRGYPNERYGPYGPQLIEFA